MLVARVTSDEVMGLNLSYNVIISYQLLTVLYYARSKSLGDQRYDRPI